MKLTKEQIETEMSAAVRDGWLSVSNAEEIFRLALLGLERDERHAFVAGSVEHGQEKQCAHPAPDGMRRCGYPENAQIHRDARAYRIGRAVLAAGDDLARFAIDAAVDAIRNGSGFDPDDTTKLRAIAAALRGDAER